MTSVLNRRTSITVCALALAAAGCLLWPAGRAWAATPWSTVIAPDNSFYFHITQGETPVLSLGVLGWGPHWGWSSVESKQKAEGDRLKISRPYVFNKATGDVIQLGFEAFRRSPREISFQYDLSAEKDVPLTQIVAVVAAVEKFNAGKLVLDHPDGKQTTLNLPLGRGEHPPTSKAVFQTRGAAPIAISIDPPCSLHIDGALRVRLAADVFKRGSRRVTLTFTFPEDVAFLASQADVEHLTRTIATPEWFPFRPSAKPVPSVIQMDEWLDGPAGKHGGVRMVGDRFEFEDHTPVKFWGTNLSYGWACAPEKKAASLTAARFARYGINGVRLHKFTYPNNIADGKDSTKMDPKGLDRLDYFASEMKNHGVYFGWSHTYGFVPGPANRDRLVAYDEIIKNGQGNATCLINFAEDVQDLMIEMVVGLLGHKNPYTGLTYAEEPALSYIEVHNEDDIFWWTSGGVFENRPLYKKYFQKRFAKWLTKKYGSDEGLRTAWKGALKSGEKLAAANIAVETQPWSFSDGALPGAKGGPRERLLDCARFLHYCQNAFYGKFAKAVRAAGYKGPLVGSAWQAPAMMPHYCNLRSDYLVGYIDRHNYFGGGLFDTMLTHPGSGFFSSGLQQVADRPFGLSEWIHVYPSLYSAEGPAIMAAYGFGLQGWDASYEFQSGAGRNFADIVGNFPWGVWEADVPTQVGQFPALARMIFRGDVQESPVISARRLSAKELADGRFSFSDTVQTAGDVKSFGGSVPAEALAAGRLVVEFTKDPQPSTFPDMTKYREGTTIVSATKQLRWDTGDKGFFTVDTPGTKAVVGFAEGRDLALGDVTVRMGCPYASIFLTALDKKATLANAKRALLSVVARNCNSGFTYFALNNRVMDNGKTPILLEPVKATITLAGRKIAAVHVLDHDGARTGKTLPLDGGRINIDGARDKALYYEVVFE